MTLPRPVPFGSRLNEINGSALAVHLLAGHDRGWHRDVLATGPPGTVSRSFASTRRRTPFWNATIVG